MDTLTARKSAFCREYIIDLNATQAAIRAGYSEKTARSQAQRLLTNVDIQSELRRLMDERARRTEISADMVLRELVRVALVDIAEAFNPDGSLKPISEMPEELRRAVSGVDVFEEFEGRGSERKQIGFTKKVRFWDKPKALEMLGRHLRLFTDKLEMTGKDGGPIAIEDSRPSATDIAQFSTALFEGFRSYRDDAGNPAELDGAATVSLGQVIAAYAAGEVVPDDPNGTGYHFARIWSRRARLKETNGR